MSKTWDNILALGLSGSVTDRVVLKWYGDRYVLSKKPTFKKKCWTSLQKEKRRNFGQVSRYASKLSKNAEVRQIYEKKVTSGQTILNLIMKDIFSGEIEKIIRGIKV